ncbi:MAG: MFS transporter [Candidatus Bathyarchaeota archaeon]|nr:MFS transporter [Candidatus Bathyarchaeota archaeon]
MSEKETHAHNQTKFLVPSLFFSQLATRPSGILTGFILIEMGLTFGTTVGVMGQIITASSIIGMIAAPIMAALSIKYRQRTLLLTGIALITISALGCSVAPNYAVMLLTFSLNGLGTAMVGPMVMSLVGEHLPQERRSGAIGLIVASTPMLSTVTGLMINIITSRGWRTAYVIYVLPIAVISLILSFLGLPSSRKIKEKEAQSISILDGFKRIVRHRSALSCLVGTSLAMAAWTSVVSYGISFFRQQFQTPTEWAGMIWSGMALCFTIGSLVTGRLVDSYGRRPLTYISALLIGILTISFTNVPSLQVSIFFALLTSVLAGLRHSVSNSLSLEQVPEFRGAMMSLNSGSLRLGVALGSAIGGLALTLGGYNLVGISLGFLGIVSGLVYSLFTVDPTIN